MDAAWDAITMLYFLHLFYIIVLYYSIKLVWFILINMVKKKKEKKERKENVSTIEKSICFLSISFTLIQEWWISKQFIQNSQEVNSYYSISAYICFIHLCVTFSGCIFLSKFHTNYFTLTKLYEIFNSPKLKKRLSVLKTC